MIKLLYVGDSANSLVKQYYVESEEELSQITDAPVGSTVLILTDKGLVVKMLHSSGQWIDI